MTLTRTHNRDTVLQGTLDYQKENLIGFPPSCLVVFPYMIRVFQTSQFFLIFFSEITICFSSCIVFNAKLRFGV